MSYSVAVSSSGQITLPAALRKSLGIGKRVTINRQGDKIMVEREQTFDERMKKVHQEMAAYEAKHPEVAERRKKYSGMLAKEIIDAWLETPEGKAEAMKDAGL